MCFIPQKLNIGGHEVPINIGEKNEKFKALEILGELDKEKWTIDIKGDMSTSFSQQVLAHEILHGLFSAACINIVEGLSEENLCQGLENQFFRFLADNDLSFFRPTLPASGGDSSLPPATPGPQPPKP